MKNKLKPTPFAGSQLDDTRHVCAFFNSNEEGYRVLLPFIKDGFESGDKAVHVVNPDQHTHHLQRLTSAGIDTIGTRQSGQLEIRTNTDAYLVNGRFDKERMLETFEGLATKNSKGKFPVSRIVCHMDWAADDQKHIDDLVEFESRVNHVWDHHDDSVICVYDLAKFSGTMVMDMVRTHPMIIIGGLLQRNPFFVPPEKFLPELRHRRAG